MRQLVAGVAFLAVVSGAQVHAQDSKEEQLRAFFVKLADAAESGDKEAYTSLFSPEAGMFLPNRPPLLGRRQVGDWFVKFRDTVVLVLDSYKQERIDVVGDVAMVRSRGIGHYLVKKTAEKVPFDQKYLDILQYKDGAWSMAYHVASSSQFKPGLWERDWEPNP